ncbi:sodium hydrogen antiporter subunitF, ShaF [Azotobacter vinelandii CA]|uniref:Sodium hydrogen antiporter subunitF, ShaF n=2 Tax=Azotobacter vinelandii TaxID=354 RepID=C1DEI1_AZOVD|nr:K+/H+ antiporter subunit F [Azotobacter vinelandii]ACO78166.1 sodium hydrogen antiporter subunitF, ShaF [Azotobacter vinelandii DJ]AGK13991.1 sodium hydrogen antiporter subunitF, ShaF [Azotobacter vinelandii CA]AGK18808.1 sodium hydrogen antiporter subunitF, ShaF [Azotobacter vinelandii CA6]WKN23874.1 K+/H+ antiporter subunit F [Azotobacter vinelandii]SFX55291.1 multisubunit potassium/proton antiporter, PhaF subunit [Azotobacter vinelandii]
MLAHVIPFCLAVIGLAMILNLVRLIRGPSPADRILALDTLYINALALIVLLGIRQASELFFEAALLIAAMGFVGTVAAGKYLSRGDILD